MKIAKLHSNGSIEIFPSKTKAAEDANIERRHFERLLKKNNQVITDSGVYSYPTIHKTKRWN